jgi:arginine/ornithine N-succinyltransferase beta subunit
MERTPNLPSNSPEGVRSEKEVTDIISSAIKEVIDTFQDNMSNRDREMLSSVLRDSFLPPVPRVTCLIQIQGAVGVTEDLKNYINQVLATLRQKLTPAEQLKFRGWGEGQNALNDIP